MNQTISSVAIRRHNGGEPILAPTGRSWEDGVTFNAAATYLAPTDANRAIIQRLLASSVGLSSPKARNGLVAVHYRARPKSSPGYLITQSYVGLALFTPDYELLYRFPEPVLSPDPKESGVDYLGVEDPRVTRIGDKFHMVYCGCGLEAPSTWRGTLCRAESTDLLNWSKRGGMDLRIGSTNNGRSFDDSYFDNLKGAVGAKQHVNNKDGVLCEGPVGGWHYLLHRPMLGPISEWSINLARSPSIDGPWTDLGPIAWAKPHADYQDAWLGAGAVPLDLGDGRQLEIYHSGHRAADGSRLYTLGAFVMNFNKLDPARPTSIIESRLDHFMVPETKWEIEGPYPDSVGNVLFACGAFEKDGEIHILYGGGDTFVMAATVNKAELLDALVPVNGN